VGAMTPFDKHDADTGSLSSCGSTLVTQASEAINNGSATRQAYSPAIDSVTGVCSPQIASADQAVSNGSESVSGELAWAAVVSRYWGSQVTDFNSRVDEIKTNLSDQGPHYGAEGEDGEEPTDADIADAKAEKTAAAKRDWWSAYRTYIEDGQTTTSNMLRDGPTKANMQTAIDVGAMPPMKWDYTWSDFVNGMASQVVPPTDQGAWGVTNWALGRANFAASSYSTWRQWSRSRFAPRGPDGRYIPYRNASWARKKWLQSKPSNWQSTAGNGASNAKWATASKWMRRGGHVLSFVGGSIDQWTRDANRTDLSSGERVTRSATRGGLNLAGTAAGAWAGGKVGAGVGAMVGGPVGAAVGGVIGGVVGGVIGSGVANEVADHVVDAAGDAYESVSDWTSDRLDDAGEMLSDAKDALTFWD